MNNELKAKYFAGYYGQKVARKSIASEEVFLIVPSIMNRCKRENYYLSLRSIDSLTDEEKYVLAKILQVYPEDVLDWMNGSIQHDDFNHPMAFFCSNEYLRSRGIALSCFDPETNELIPVEKLVEIGWVILKPA